MLHVDETFAVTVVAMLLIYPKLFFNSCNENKNEKIILSVSFNVVNMLVLFLSFQG